MDLNFTMIDNHASGFMTKRDRSQLPPGAMRSGSQNITITDGDRIGVRRGSLLFGAANSAITPIRNAFTHRRRDGVEVQVRTYSTLVEYFHPDTDAWETLKTGFTTGLQFGFADYDRSADATAHLRFGNAVESDQRWNGQFTQLDGALSGGEATITVDSTTGFTTTGSLIIGTTSVTYTGKTATTFTGASGTPAASDDAAVAQLPTEDGTNPKGNIYKAFQNRLAIANVTDANNAVFISAVDNDLDFAFSTPRVDGQGAILNVAEGAGTITGMATRATQLFVGKETGWHIIEFRTFSDDNTDFPFLQPVSADARNPFLGPENPKSVIVWLEDIYFAAKNGGIKRANRLAEVQDPLELSDPIRPTVDAAVFNDSAAIVFDNKAYISAKQSDTSTHNDIVFVFNFEKGTWESPIKGWNVSAWNIADAKLFGHSSINPESFQFLIDRTADVRVTGTEETPIKALFISGDQNFGSRPIRKEFDAWYVEGFISANTTLTCRINYEYDGNKGTRTATILGTDGGIILDPVSTAELGMEELALEELAFTETTLLPKFRLYLTTTSTPFYEISFEFESDGIDQEWEVLAWGVNARVKNQIDISLKRQLITS